MCSHYPNIQSQSNCTFCTFNLLHFAIATHLYVQICTVHLCVNHLLYYVLSQVHIILPIWCFCALASHSLMRPALEVGVTVALPCPVRSGSVAKSSSVPVALASGHRLDSDAQVLDVLLQLQSLIRSFLDCLSGNPVNSRFIGIPVQVSVRF